MIYINPLKNKTMDLNKSKISKLLNKKYCENTQTAQTLNILLHVYHEL